MSPGWTQCINMMLAGLQFPVFTTASKHQSVAGLTWGRGKVSEVRLRGWAEVEGLFLPVWPIVCARASSSGLLPLKQRATHTLRSCFCLLYNTEQWAETLRPPLPKIAWSRLFKGKLDFAFLFPALGLKFWTYCYLCGYNLCTLFAIRDFRAERKKSCSSYHRAGTLVWRSAWSRIESWCCTLLRQTPPLHLQEGSRQEEDKMQFLFLFMFRNLTFFILCMIDFYSERDFKTRTTAGNVIWVCV